MKPEPCQHETLGSEQPDSCAFCAYLAAKYAHEPWEDATWD